MSKLFRRASNVTTASPPSYNASATDTELPPPFVDFPSSYRVGRRDASLVPLEQVKSHLILLGAFHKLRTTVEAQTTGWAGELEPKARWSVFVAVAVKRLEAYLEASEKVMLETVYDIPLDVALCLHAYQLNPRTFLLFCLSAPH
jgi:hypothetical protein